MDRRSRRDVTLAFPDRLGRTQGPTVQDEEMLVRKLPKPTSAVDCAVPAHLRLWSSRPAAMLRRLDVSGAVIYLEHAIPNEAEAWLPLMLPRGTTDIRCRVIQTFQRRRGACWVAELKFEVSDNAMRTGIVGLVKALKLRNRQRAAV